MPAMYRELPDFDTLLTMHRENPDELEKVRTELTDEVLKQAPRQSRRRLEGLQFRIDMELRRARTPAARCIRMSSMMHDAVWELNQLLHNPHEIPGNRGGPDTSAEILKFSRRAE